MKNFGMSKKAAVFMGSPRKAGNTNLLVDAFVRGRVAILSTCLKMQRQF